MSEMIERVKLAIRDACDPHVADSMCEVAARAAIEAMRECDDKMLRAFWDGAPASVPQNDGYPDDSRSSEWYGDADDFKKGWAAAIDEALK